jgi:hypothetical protein
LLRDLSGLLMDAILAVVVIQLAKFVARVNFFDETNFRDGRKKVPRGCIYYVHRKIAQTAGTILLARKVPALIFQA